MIGLFLFYQTTIIFKDENKRTEIKDISEVPDKGQIYEDIAQETISNIKCLQECSENLQNPKPQVPGKRFSLKSILVLFMSTLPDIYYFRKSDSTLKICTEF